MKKKKKTSAFTLIETILAVTIIGMVITGVADLTQSSLKIGRITMDQFAAHHLAEEGLEIVRAMRDSNWLQNQSWNTGLKEGLYSVEESREAQFWHLSPLAAREAAPFITLKPSAPFRRTIEIKEKKNGEGKVITLLVTSLVTYGDADSLKKMQLETELTDWKKGPI